MATRSNDAVWQNLKRKLEKTSGFAKVGILAAKGGNETSESGKTMVEIGAIHEFGAPKANIPERSFIRRTFQEKERDLKTVIAKLAKAVVTGKMTMHRALDNLGAWGSAEVKKTVTSGKHVPPALKAATIAARARRSKGSDRPLVDTGRMVDSITWVVVD